MTLYTYEQNVRMARLMKLWPKRPAPRPSYIETEAERPFMSEVRLIRARDKLSER